MTKTSNISIWVLAFLMVFSGMPLFAQDDNEGLKTTRDSTDVLMPAKRNLVLDGAYEPQGNELKKLVPYVPLREADVMYQKRIGQEIDLRQKFNHPYYYPLKRIADRASLFDVLTDAVFPELSDSKYELKAYVDDEFSDIYSKEELRAKMMIGSWEDEEDDDGNLTGEKYRLYTRVVSQDITRFQIKEDWIWDRERSERYIRIIAIAPCKEEKVGDNKYVFKPMYWLDWRDVRWVLLNAEAYNPFNDAQRRTYEELFRKRYFSSYIIKEGNTYDREISEYARGVGALSKSEEIQAKLFNLEHDMWNY